MIAIEFDDLRQRLRAEFDEVCLLGRIAQDQGRLAATMQYLEYASALVGLMSNNAALYRLATELERIERNAD